MVFLPQKKESKNYMKNTPKRYGRIDSSLKENERIGTCTFRVYKIKKYSLFSCTFTYCVSFFDDNQVILL